MQKVLAEFVTLLNLLLKTWSFGRLPAHYEFLAVWQIDELMF